MSKTGLAGEFRKIRTGAQASLQLCRLPVRFQVQSGPTDTGLVAEPSRENTETAIPTVLSSPANHVLDSFTNSHRKASSSRPTSYETHSVTSQKPLEGSGITRKGDTNSQVPAPPFTMVAERRQCTYRPTITPSANIYIHIKRRVWGSLRRAHCKRKLVPSRKQATDKLSGTKISLSSLKIVSRSLLRQDSTCSYQQHHSGVIYKQGRRHEVGPTLCPTMENLDLDGLA